MKNIVIFGSTGSVGTQVLDVIRQNPNHFRVLALVAHSSDKKLLEQINEFKPKFACLLDTNKAASFPTPKGTSLLTGDDTIEVLAKHDEADVLFVTMLGAVNSLRCMLAGISADKFIAIASKEAYVCAGDLINRALKNSNAKIVPIDSEHSAIYQLVQNENTSSIRKIILTASGGALYEKTPDEIATATVDTVLKHPNWNMGAKITVDCATLINKGLEIIEASHLFNTEPARIDYVIHRQSLVHGIVEFDCGTTTFNLYSPDMRVPINYALSLGLAYTPTLRALGQRPYKNKSNSICACRGAAPAPAEQHACNTPKRLHASNKNPSYEDLNKMTFEQNQNKNLRGVDLCRRAMELGLCAHLNFANDILVQRFLKKEISFLDIYIGIEKILDHFALLPKIMINDTSALVEIEKKVEDFLQNKT